MSSEPRPVYLRLRDHIAAAILDGRYADGDPLPSVRAFAAEQGANPLTVAKAYQGFQDEGLILVKRGVGMFVAPGASSRLAEVERERDAELVDHHRGADLRQDVGDMAERVTRDGPHLRLVAADPHLVAVI